MVAAWPTLDDGWRAVVLELIGKRERWEQYLHWAAGVVAKLVSEGLRHGWAPKRLPRPARTGTWYVTLRRGPQSLALRIANHHRKLNDNLRNVVWGQGDDRALADVLAELRRPQPVDTGAEGVTA